MKRSLLIALAAGYPLLVYASVRLGAARGLALCVAIALLVRGAFLLRSVDAAVRRRLLVPFAGIGLPAAGAALLDDPRVLLLLPVGVNAALLFAFGRTLRSGPSMAESFARLRFAELSPEEVRYCRTVSAVWCGFFTVNGAVAGGLALAGALEAWAIYTGLLAYLAVGLLYTVELLYRHWRFRRYGGAATDPLLRRLFPPRSAA